MKLIDRYVLQVFLAALGVFLAAFLALFLVIDFSSKLGRFLSLGSVSFLAFILEYYACRLPLFLIYLLPTLPLFAAMFTMIRLQKTNEILPIVAAGISLRRLTVPFVIASLAACFVVAGLDEFALPPMSRKIAETDEILLTEEVSFARVLYDGRGNHVWATSYDHVNKLMRGVVLVKISPHLRHQLIVNAKQCQWNAERASWILTDGTMLPYDADGKPVEEERVPGQPPRRRVDSIAPAGYILDSDIQPEDLQRKFTIAGQFYSLRELSRMIAKEPGRTSLRMLRHAKFSNPLSSVIILIVGLPFVVSARAKSYFLGLTLCLLVVVAYYAVNLATLELGKAGRIEVAPAAWLSPVLFGTLGLVLFRGMRS